MNKREKTLALIVGGLVVVVGGYRLVLPMVDQYVFAVSRDNETLETTIFELEQELGDIEPFRQRYGMIVARTGGTEVAKVEDRLRATLTRLIDSSGLREPRISPRPRSEYRPSGKRLRDIEIGLLRFSVTAEGTLESITKFLEEFYELPYIAQLTELNLDPPSGRSARGNKLVKMSAQVEALVPPQHAVAEINPEHLTQPDKHVKHVGRQYALIASREPFTEYQEPPPPEPEPEPEPKPTRIVRTPEPPKPPPGDPQRENKYIRMVMMYGIDEVLVANTRDNSTEYVSVGGELDGGDVLLIHPLGTVSRREDGTTRVYPVGEKLADGISIDEADVDYPEIVYAYESVREREEAEALRQAAEQAENEEAAGDSESDAQTPVKLGEEDATAAEGSSEESAAKKRPVRRAPRRRTRGKPATSPADEGNKGETPGAKSGENDAPKSEGSSEDDKSAEDKADASKKDDGSNEDDDG